MCVCVCVCVCVCGAITQLVKKSSIECAYPGLSKLASSSQSDDELSHNYLGK